MVFFLAVLLLKLFSLPSYSKLNNGMTYDEYMVFLILVWYTAFFLLFLLCDEVKGNDLTTCLLLLNTCLFLPVCTRRRQY